MSLMESRHPKGSSVVEWTATVRGHEVRCWWRGDSFGGDAEVLERMAHLDHQLVDLSTLDGVRAAVMLVLLDPVESGW